MYPIRTSFLENAKLGTDKMEICENLNKFNINITLQNQAHKLLH